MFLLAGEFLVIFYNWRIEFLNKPLVILSNNACISGTCLFRDSFWVEVL